MVTGPVEKARDAGFDQKLSPTTYALKQMRDLLFTVVGVGGGGYLGYKFGGYFSENRKVSDGFASAFKKLFGAGGELIADAPTKWIGLFTGSFLGEAVAINILGYEHWKKTESARLSVEEINQDIAEAKLKMDPELKRENTELRKMIAEQDEQLKSMHAEKPHMRVSAHHASLDKLGHAQDKIENGIA